MNQYMALTSNDSATPALFVDTTVPLEILLDAATYRLRAVTQVLENLALRGEISSDAVVLSDFALLCSIPLRDGCDLSDVIGGVWISPTSESIQIRFSNTRITKPLVSLETKGFVRIKSGGEGKF